MKALKYMVFFAFLTLLLTSCSIPQNFANNPFLRFFGITGTGGGALTTCAENDVSIICKNGMFAGSTLNTSKQIIIWNATINGTTAGGEGLIDFRTIKDITIFKSTLIFRVDGVASSQFLLSGKNINITDSKLVGNEPTGTNGYSWSRLQINSSNDTFIFNSVINSTGIMQSNAPTCEFYFKNMYLLNDSILCPPWGTIINTGAQGDTGYMLFQGNNLYAKNTLIDRWDKIGNSYTILPGLVPPDFITTFNIVNKLIFYNVSLPIAAPTKQSCACGGGYPGDYYCQGNDAFLYINASSASFYYSNISIKPGWKNSVCDPKPVVNGVSNLAITSNSMLFFYNSTYINVFNTSTGDVLNINITGKLGIFNLTITEGNITIFNATSAGYSLGRYSTIPFLVFNAYPISNVTYYNFSSGPYNPIVNISGYVLGNYSEFELQTLDPYIFTSKRQVAGFLNAVNAFTATCTADSKNICQLKIKVKNLKNGTLNLTGLVLNATATTGAAQELVNFTKVSPSQSQYLWIYANYTNPQMGLNVNFTFRVQK
jgi:hypothetical protein